MNLKPVEGLKEIYFQRRRPIYIIGAGGGYWQRDPLPEGKSRANAVVGFEEPVLCADAAQVCVHCVSLCATVCALCVRLNSTTRQLLGSRPRSRNSCSLTTPLEHLLLFSPSITLQHCNALGARSQLTSWGPPATQVDTSHISF